MQNKKSKSKDIIAAGADFLSAKQVAVLMQVSVRTVRRWIDTKAIPSERVGGIRRVPRSFIDSLGQKKE